MKNDHSRLTYNVLGWKRGLDHLPVIIRKQFGVAVNRLGAGGSKALTKCKSDRQYHPARQRGWSSGGMQRPGIESAQLVAGKMENHPIIRDELARVSLAGGMGVEKLELAAQVFKVALIDCGCEQLLNDGAEIG